MPRSFSFELIRAASARRLATFDIPDRLACPPRSETRSIEPLSLVRGIELQRAPQQPLQVLPERIARVQLVEPHLAPQAADQNTAVLKTRQLVLDYDQRPAQDGGGTTPPETPKKEPAK